jgi:hypothetical protein
MPPKQSNKAKTKEKEKKIEDATFGMKNKNRSAKVQKYVQMVESSVKQGSQADRAKAADRDKKMSAKEARIAYEEEMKRLFKAVPDPKKGAGAEEDEDGEGPKVDDEGNYLWTADDFEGVDAAGLLEEQLEAEREALKGRTDLTPVTEASFKAWRERKIAEKAEAEKKRLAKAKSTGTGLRGSDLWHHDASLFVDDADALEEFEREEDVEYDVDDDDDDEAAPAEAKHVDPAAA